MAIISFTQRDLLRSTVVTPGWYLVEVNEVTEKPSKDQASTNFPVEATIIQNDDNGDTQFAGVPIDWMFNSKAIGFAAGYLAALGITPEVGQRLDLAKTKGEKLVVFIENETYMGNVKNRVNHKYRPVKA